MLDVNKFRRELNSQKMTIADLSARSGMSYAHLSNIKNGKVRHVKLDTIMKIAHHLNDIPLHRLISDKILNLGRQDFLDSVGSLLKEERLLYLEEALDKGLKAPILPNRYPIIGHVRAHGRHTLPSDFGKDEPSKHSNETIPFDNINDSDAYAVVMDDTTMSPYITPGSILIFGPSYKVDDMSLCLVRSKDSDKVWVRYLAIREHQCILLTKGEITEPIVLNLSEISQMHRCVGRYLAEEAVALK